MKTENRLENFINSSEFENLLPSLYGSAYNLEFQRGRYLQLIGKHKELFKDLYGAESGLFSTAGRSELGGNHTDHNLGKVFAATINLDTIATVTPIEGDKVTLISEGFPPVEVELNNLEVVEEEKGSTHALVRGIAAGFVKQNFSIGGFVANTSTRVLKGSGLSSSAAIEMLVATIFNALYNENRVSVVEMAKIAQFAENQYFGKPSGLMDQIACGYGGVVRIDFSTTEIVPLGVDFRALGYDLVVVDTGSTHADLTDDYASIPAEMGRVAQYFGREVLSGVSYEEFLEKLPEIREGIGNDRALLRAHHFILENQRVEEMVRALEGGDIEEFLSLVNQSGQSSFNYLQNIYSTHDIEEQGLALALALSEHFLGGEGACRVHGGGFGGTIQAYIPIDKTGEYITFMEKFFGKGSVTPLAVRGVPTLRLDKFIEQL